MNKVFNVQGKDVKITLKGPMSETPNINHWGHKNAQYNE